ncbi:glycosyltransferase [Kibdelosporangium persicum]|uniref:N-acetylglucosaminyl-diphospho-decaprenol L-rhamnosyltransferase n=1 Tax=Kibdelosporangium persicum TaxID=2698649 RepID=A0ABX2FBU7_9PSEU|nr:glycosyltransferase [Kibdelosporangium persicum]NRN68688.1 N-acetylglucosaminyl-diphospho-decaprenol L-rhamnosyltransferase [Kibdelosporangium persicum]
MDGQPARPLSVLVVSYRRADLLRRCLDSVHKHLSGCPVLVWDNLSEGTPAIRELQSEYPDVEWVFSDRNVGYAMAVNGLAERVRTDMVLLNPDAELTGPLTRSRAALTQERVAAVSPKVRDAEGGPDWDVARRRQTVLRGLVSHSGYGKRLRGKAVSDYYAEQPVEVDGYLSGCCLLIAREAWDRLGGFDEKFFLYGEESDWQRKAHDNGWRLVLADEQDVRHGAAGTLAGDPLAERRARDLLRAGHAEMLGMSNYGPGAIFTAGLTVLDRVQRSHRRKRATEKAAARAKADLAKPSILLTSNELCQGGAERQRVLLANELSRRGYPVTVACLQHFGPLTPELDPSVRLVLTPWWQPLVDLPTKDAVLITGVTNTEAGFAAGWKVLNPQGRWLAATHEPAEPDRPTYGGKLAKVISRSDGVIALSPRHWAAITRHQHLNERHFVAPNGVPRQQDRGFTASTPVRLGMLCRMVEHKNPHLLVAALDSLPDLDWTLDLHGDGPDRAKLEAKTPGHLRDRVRWHGASPGPDHAFRTFDVLCVPSRAEAFPLVIVEAMARGLPVVSSAVGSVPDLLDNGRAGVLVEPVTAAAWAAALRPILEQPARLEPLAAAGAKRAAELYTVDAMADAYETAIAAAR